MCMFLDSPIEYCPVANRYVLLDQTQDACARDMDCPSVNCPLARFFAPPMRSAKHRSQRRRNQEQTPE